MKIAGVHDRATAFDGAATVYEQARPGYPAEAVRWVVEALGLGPGRTVVDLAAGTGKLTRDLVPTGARVVAVEPVAGMRRTLATSLAKSGLPTSGPVTATQDGGLSVVAAVAQALPFGDGRLDAVTVAQGFHWFATDDVVLELHRVLRPGGSLALVWNRRDESDPLQAALTGLMEPWRQGTPSHESGVWRRVLEPGGAFAAAGEFHESWRQPVDVETVAERVASVSFIAAMADDDRARLLDQVRAEASAMDAPLALPYQADVYVFRRVDAPGH